tara:strand:+ start:1011 stop:1733 length:723 start_codon:yes stop_codon:yes gene_type:complete
MNKYSKLSKEEKLAVCCIINSEAKWYFHQLLDNDGNGTDDIYEFLNDYDDIVQFNVHRTSDDEIRCYLSGDIDNDEVPDDKLILIDNFLNREYFISAGDSQEGPFSFDILKRKKIKTNTNVWYDGLDDWTEANSIIELKSLFLRDAFKNNINSNYDVENRHNYNKNNQVDISSEEDWYLCILFCFFLGVFGAHRFYTGKKDSGIIMLFTAGGLYIWWLIDLITILSGNFKNSKGQLIRKK